MSISKVSEKRQKELEAEFSGANLIPQKPEDGKSYTDGRILDDQGGFSYPPEYKDGRIPDGQGGFSYLPEDGRIPDGQGGFSFPPEEPKKEAKPVTLDDVVRDRETFELYYKNGYFDMQEDWTDMVGDIAYNLIADTGHGLSTIPEGAYNAFFGTKKEQAEGVATRYQIYGNNWVDIQQLVKGVGRGFGKMIFDDESDEDITSSYNYWKAYNELEKERLGMYADIAKNEFFTFGIDPEVLDLVQDKKVAPDWRASRGLQTIVDPLNLPIFGLGYKAGKGSMEMFRGAERGLIRETQKKIIQKALLDESIRAGTKARFVADKKGVVQDLLKGKTKLSAEITENLDKIKSMSPNRQQQLLDFASTLPNSHPLKKTIEQTLKGIPPKGSRHGLGIVAGAGSYVGGKVLENAGNIMRFLQRLPEETVVNFLMRNFKMTEEVAMRNASIISNIGAPALYGVGAYNLIDSFTDNELLSGLGATMVALPLFSKFGRDMAIIGREMMQPATELSILQRIGSLGDETLADIAIDRTKRLPIRSTFGSVAGASVGEIGKRSVSALGQKLSSKPVQGAVEWLNDTGVGRYLESAGRVANQGAMGATIGGIFGIASNPESPEGFIAGATGGTIFGTTGYAVGRGINKGGELLGFQNTNEAIRARHGNHQYFVKNLLPAGQKDAFSALPKDVQIAYASAAMSYPHTTFRFERMGKGEKGGKQYRIDDEFYIDVNVDSDWAVEPLVRHEVSHYLEAVGGTRAFDDILIGNPLFEQVGLFTKKDPKTGKPILKRNKKGEVVGYETNANFDEYKYKYGRFSSPDALKAEQAWNKVKDTKLADSDYGKELKEKFEQAKQRVIDQVPDHITAREIVAEHGADYFLSDPRRYRDLRSGLVGNYLRSLLDSPVLNNLPFLRNTIAKLGGTFRADGMLDSKNNLFANTKRIPAVTQLLRKYNKKIEGVAKDKLPNKIDIPDDAEGKVILDVKSEVLANNPEIVDVLRSGTFMKIDANGDIVPNQAMVPKEIRDYNKRLALAISDSITQFENEEGLPVGHMKQRRLENGDIAFEGRFLDERVIDMVEKRGNWNKSQIDMLRSISRSLQNNENSKGGNDWLISYFKATQKGGGKYVNARVQNGVHVPYGLYFTSKGNFIVRTVSVDQFVKNFDKAMRRQGKDIVRLFGADDPRRAFMDATHIYHKNHAEGRAGREGLDPDIKLAQEKADFINAMFGATSKEHRTKNPWLADAEGTKDDPRATYRSLRLERIGKADQLSGKRHVEPRKIFDNFMPEKSNMPENQQSPNYMPEAPDTPEFRRFFKNSEIVDENGNPQVLLHTGKKNFSEFAPTRNNLFKNGLMFFTSRPEFASKWAEGQGGQRKPSQETIDRADKIDKTVDHQKMWEDEFGDAKFGDVPEEKADALFNKYRKKQAEAFKPFTSRGDMLDKADINIYPVFISAQKVFDGRKHADIAMDYFKSAKDDDTLSVYGEKELKKLIQDGNYLILEKGGLVEYLDSKGFDALRISEETTAPEYSTIAVWDNKKIKSAIGNRGTFDPSNPDIRFMPEAPKTPEFKNWFNNSKVVDENGNPKIVYHGTFNDFVEFDRNYAKDNYGRPDTSMDMVGSWFTTEHQSKFYADPEKPLGDKVGKTMEVFLSIQNPYVVDWQGQNPLEVYTTRTKKIEDAIADFEETNIAFEYNKINEKLIKTGKGTNSLNDYERSVLLDYREERKKYLDNFREAKSNASKQDTLTRFSKIVEEKGGSEGFRDWAKGQGYDGVYLQETTGDAFGEFNPADMWIAFEPNQIKSATNNTGAFDPKNPNINFMPKKAKGAEGLRLLDDDVVQLDKSNLEYFMPAKGVNLEDYMDRKTLALAIDRLGIGQRKTGPEGAKKIIDIDAQGGRGFMYIYKGGGWAFKGKGTANSFLKRLKEVAGEDESVLVGLTILADYNHLNSPFGQLAYANALQATIDSGAVPKKIVDQHIKEIAHRIHNAKRTKDDVAVWDEDDKAVIQGKQKAGELKNRWKKGDFTFSDDIRQKLLPITSVESYIKAIEKKDITFDVASKIITKAKQKTLPIEDAKLQELGIDIPSVASDIIDKGLEGLPMGDVVGLLEVPVNQTPEHSKFHYSYPYTIVGKPIGFLNRPRYLGDLTKSKKIYNKEGKISAQPIQTVMPVFDKLNPDLYMPEFYSDVNGFKDNIRGQVFEKLKQDKFSPQQLKAKLKETKGALEMAEDIDLDSFLEGKKSVSKMDVFEYITEQAPYLDFIDVAEQSDTGHTRWGAFKENGFFSNYSEFLLRLPEDSRFKGRDKNPNAMSHWEDDRVIAHARTTERFLEGGGKTFHIEEVQSDWHQYARDRGYDNTADSNAIGKLKEELNVARDAFFKAEQNFFESKFPDFKKRFWTEEKRKKLFELDAWIAKKKLVGDPKRADEVIRANKLYYLEAFSEYGIGSYDDIRDGLENMDRDLTTIWGATPREIWMNSEGYKVLAELTKYKNGVDQFVRGMYRDKETKLKPEKDKFLQAEKAHDEVANSDIEKQSNAPFKNSWRHRMLSELIKKAVESGYKHISWVTGARSSEMNRLDQHFSSVLVRETKPPVQKTSDGVELPPIPDQSVAKKYSISAKALNGSSQRKSVNRDELVQLIGKEYANEAISKLEKGDYTYGNSDSVELLDIKKPHEGRRRSYDVMLPQTAGRIAKIIGSRKPTKGRLFISNNDAKTHQEVWVMELPDNMGDVGNIPLYMPMTAKEIPPSPNPKLITNFYFAGEQGGTALGGKMAGKTVEAYIDGGSDEEPENSYFKN